MVETIYLDTLCPFEKSSCYSDLVVWILRSGVRFFKRNLKSGFFKIKFGLNFDKKKQNTKQIHSH